MNISTALYRIHLREADRERGDYLDLLSQARTERERMNAQVALDDHDARIRGVRCRLEALEAVK
jgi:hypothetical protein